MDTSDERIAMEMLCERAAKAGDGLYAIAYAILKLDDSLSSLADIQADIDRIADTLEDRE